MSSVPQIWLNSSISILSKNLKAMIVSWRWAVIILSMDCSENLSISIYSWLFWVSMLVLCFFLNIIAFCSYPDIIFSLWNEFGFIRREILSLFLLTIWLLSKLFRRGFSNFGCSMHSIKLSASTFLSAIYRWLLFFRLVSTVE